MSWTPGMIKPGRGWKGRLSFRKILWDRRARTFGWRHGFCKRLHSCLVMPDNSLFGKIRACFSIKDKNKTLLDKIKVRRNRNKNEKIDLQRVCLRLALTLLPVIEYSNKIKWNNEKQTFTGGREYGAPDCLRCFKRKWVGMIWSCCENIGTSVALYGRTIEEWTGYRLFSPFYLRRKVQTGAPHRLDEWFLSRFHVAGIRVDRWWGSRKRGA